MIVVPDFVMDMRSGAAARRSQTPDRRAPFNLHAGLNSDAGKVTIACMNPESVVDFHHIAVAAAVSGKCHKARSGGMHRRAPGTREIHAGMKGITAGKGIEPGAETAGALEAGALDRNRERDVAHLEGQIAQLPQNGTGVEIGGVEGRIVNAIDLHVVQRDFGTAHACAFAAILVWN